MKYPKIIEKIRKFFKGKEINIEEEEGKIKIVFEDYVSLNKEKFEKFYEFLKRNGYKLIGHEEEPSYASATHEITIYNDVFYGNDYEINVFYTRTWNIKQGESFVLHEMTIIPK